MVRKVFQGPTTEDGTINSGLVTVDTKIEHHVWEVELDKNGRNIKNNGICHNNVWKMIRSE